MKNGKVQLTVDGQNVSEKYRLIVNELEGQQDMIIDGVITVVDHDGKPDPSLLAGYEGTGDLAFYVFGLLSFECKSWLNHTLIQRKEMLLHVLKKLELLLYSDDFANGGQLFSKIKEMGLAGIVAKRKTSKYTPGKSGDWIVIKVEQPLKPVKAKPAIKGNSKRLPCPDGACLRCTRKKNSKRFF